MTEGRSLDDWCSTYMQYTKKTEPPVMYHRWVAMSVIAAALQRKCFLKFGHVELFPNLYVVLVGPSGCGKSFSMSIGQRFLRDLTIPMASEAITCQALIQDMAEIARVEMKEGRVAHHSSITVFSKELAVFIGYNNEIFISHLTDWYDCDEKWTYRTKGSGVDELRGVWVNLLGATTLDLIQTSLPLGAIGGGFTSRVIFVYEREKAQLLPVPFLPTDLYEPLKRDLEQISMLDGEFRMTPEFYSAYEKWYIDQAKNPPIRDKTFEGYCERRRVHILKLCMIFSASRSNEMILRVEDLERADRLLRKTETNMPMVFSGVGKYEHAALLSELREMVLTKRRVSLLDVRRHFARDISLDELSQLIASLQAMGFVRFITEGSEHYLVSALDYPDPSIDPKGVDS